MAWSVRTDKPYIVNLLFIKEAGHTLAGQSLTRWSLTHSLVSQCALLPCQASFMVRLRTLSTPYTVCQAMQQQTADCEFMCGGVLSPDPSHGCAAPPSGPVPPLLTQAAWYGTLPGNLSGTPTSDNNMTHTTWEPPHLTCPTLRGGGSR